MPKKSHTMPAKQLTPRQVSRWQKERKRQRLIFLIGSSIIALIVGVLGYGYYTSQLAPRWQTAVKVNNTKFNTQYYVHYLRAVLGTRPRDASTINSMTPILVRELQDNELIRQAATNFDISVTEEDINQSIRESLIRPEEKDKLSETEIQERVNNFTANVSVPIDFLKEIIAYDVYRNKLREKLEIQVPTQAEQVKLSAILLDTDVTAIEVRAKLDSGGDFTALAKEFSKDENTKDKGGDMGWVPKGLYPELDEAAFSLPVATPSQPIATPNGYYILLVTEKKDSSAISEEALQILKSKALSDWMEETRKKSELEDFLIDKASGIVYPAKLNWILRQLK